MSDSIINVGLIGAGSMGRGLAMQIKATPGMRLQWVADTNEDAAAKAAAMGGAQSGTDALRLLETQSIDVMVEATNSIGSAADYCLAALEHGAHVVLMNAEVDLALAPLLHHEARAKNLCVTSDAGDQHGVLAGMITEADLMGFEIVQAGNIKGFLDRYATPQSIAYEAAKRRLSATQCCAYTDGTKLHIEMAVLANAFGYLPPSGGMTGPRATAVQQALGLFEFDSYGGVARIDYLLGAEPGGGVYLVVKPKGELPAEQAFYLDYYKLGQGPYYLLYRPYHLCHLETPKAILAAMSGRPLLGPGQSSYLTSRKPSSVSPTCDVYAYAKRDLQAGEVISHAIGSANCYGLVEPLQSRRIPICLLESNAALQADASRDSPLTEEHVSLPETPLTGYWQEQQSLIQHPNE